MTDGCPFETPDCPNNKKLVCYDGDSMGCFEIWLIGDFVVLVLVVIAGVLSKARERFCKRSSEEVGTLSETKVEQYS
jgi:hypothetical protein